MRNRTTILFGVASLSALISLAAIGCSGDSGEGETSSGTSSGSAATSGNGSGSATGSGSGSGSGGEGSGGSNGAGGSGSVGDGSVLPADSAYTKHFLDLYKKIKDPANGYFSPEGVPYHAPETLIVEAPDYGHETTSEAFSYYVWLEATYGAATGDWAPFKKSWDIAEKYIIPSAQDQSTANYNPLKPATYAAEKDTPEEYPSQLETGMNEGQDPLADELKTAYGTTDIYGMHWILDVDNWYGFGHCGDGTTRPAYINTFQRGAQESVWETVPQPSCETFKHGGKNGFLDLFTKDSQYSTQVRYTNAPDADARMVQATYMAKQFAALQNKQGEIKAEIDKAAKMGDYLRYAMYDKYFKKIGNCVGAQACPGGKGKESSHYLLSWYYSWGGSYPTKEWSWRIGSSHAHFGYQNPFAAWVLANDTDIKPKSASAPGDWKTSMQRQIEFYKWLQASEGGIAGGATNSWKGRYEQPPAGTATFYGMFYEAHPVYADPPSNQWFGFQAWSMERIAAYYLETKDESTKDLLQKWVNWAIDNTKVGNGELQIPATLEWTGQPDTWNASAPSSNAGLHVKVTATGQDLGLAGAMARTFVYYAAATGDQKAQQAAKDILDTLVTTFADEKGFAVVEKHAEHLRFNDKVYVPPGFTGKMPNGDVIDSNATFLSIRSKFKQDPEWAKVQAYLDGGPAPEFKYHRFWAETDIALALAEYARLLDKK